MKTGRYLLMGVTVLTLITNTAIVRADHKESISNISVHAIDREVTDKGAAQPKTANECPAVFYQGGKLNLLLASQ